MGNDIKTLRKIIKVLRKNSKKIRSFGFKAMCWIIEIHALCCISYSYYLASQGQYAVLETLSGQLVTEIVAPVIIMGFKGMIENIFEHNNLSFSTPIQEEEKDCKNHMEG